MIKRYFLSLITCTCFYLLAASFTSKNGNYEVLKVTAPFPMQPIKVFIYPDKDFIITDFGAVNGGRVDNTKAITSAIEACNQSGGGRHTKRAMTARKSASMSDWLEKKQKEPGR